MITNMVLIDIFVDPQANMATEKSIAADCVQGFAAQFILQFTLVNALCCALHRSTNRVIHRSKIYLYSIIQYQVYRPNELVDKQQIGATHYPRNGGKSSFGPSALCLVGTTDFETDTPIKPELVPRSSYIRAQSFNSVDHTTER